MDDQILADMRHVFHEKRQRREYNEDDLVGCSDYFYTKEETEDDAIECMSRLFRRDGVVENDLNPNYMNGINRLFQEKKRGGHHANQRKNRRVEKVLQCISSLLFPCELNPNAPEYEPISVQDEIELKQMEEYNMMLADLEVAEMVFALHHHLYQEQQQQQQHHRQHHTIKKKQQTYWLQSKQKKQQAHYQCGFAMHAPKYLLSKAIFQP